jgi:GTP-binding protein Era
LLHLPAVVVTGAGDRASAGNEKTFDGHGPCVWPPKPYAIVMSRGGARLEKVGTTARQQIEYIVGTRIYLHRHVAVATDWRRDPNSPGRQGF